MKKKSEQSKKGDIQLVPFPFTDLSSAKLRPCILLGTDGDDITVVFITSKKPKGNHHIEILPSAENGIKVKSYIRYTKIATLDVKMSVGRIGVLETTTRTTLISKIVEFIG